MSGKTEVIKDYLNYISKKEKEIFPALCAIVSAANRFDINVDFVLDQYESYTTYQEQNSRIGKISEQYTSDQYGALLVNLGKYYLMRERYIKGFGAILNGLDFAIRIRNKDGILDCIKEFEKFRSYAVEEVKLQYSQLIQEV